MDCFLHKTILLQNIEFGLEIRGVEKADREKVALQALDNSGLLPYKDQFPNQLSGGMQQRVGLARALANDPEILLMDEAFSALDPLIRHEMQDELLDLQQNVKKTIIFITHDLNEALRLGDRIALMKDGQIMQVGTIGEEILKNPANDYVESFIEDIDRSKVLTAESIMIPGITTNIDVDGPNVALSKIRKAGVSLLIAVDKSRKLHGYVTVDDALRAKKEELKLADVIRTDIIEISKDTLLNDIFDLIHDSPAPVAVTDNGRLLGIIIRGAIVGALTKSNGVNVNE